MRLYLFCAMMQKSKKWPKTQIKGGGGSCHKSFLPFGSKKWSGSSISLTAYDSFSSLTFELSGEKGVLGLFRRNESYTASCPQWSDVCFASNHSGNILSLHTYAYFSYSLCSFFVRSCWYFDGVYLEAQWPIGYGVGLRIKRSSVRIRPWPLRWVLGQDSLLPLSQGEAFTLASISYLAILVKYKLAKKKKNAQTTFLTLIMATHLLSAQNLMYFFYTTESWNLIFGWHCAILISIQDQRTLAGDMLSVRHQLISSTKDLWLGQASTRKVMEITCGQGRNRTHLWRVRNWHWAHNFWQNCSN